MEASSTISKFFDADTARWFDLLIEGIVILDEKQRFVYANQAYRNHVHMDDETYAKYQGKDWIAVRRAIRAQADSISNKVFSTGRPIYNYHQRLNDGTESYSDVVPYWNRGEIVGAIIVVRDILSLRDLIQTVQEKEKYISQLNERVKGFYKTRYAFEDIIGQDYPYIKLAKKAAQTDNSVFLIGESGTGKEVVAQSIHRDSYRGGQSFVDINCASLPETLLDSELFGYVPGAFTGASKNGKIGLFELANGGTLFLDEITEMPLPLQSKLLRVLQERQIRRLGDTKNIKVDVRVIAATNKNLREEIRKGNFREDLYHRIGVVVVRVPALREHAQDIPLLVDHFIRTICAEYHIPAKRIEDEALAELQTMPWSGNIRELRNCIEYLSNLGLKDADMSKMLDKYNDYVLQRNRLLKSSSADNPYVKRITSQLEEMWPSIRLSLKNVHANIMTQKRSADSQYRLFSQRVSEVPTQEHNLNNITRQQEIKAELYLMLLQKREENYISLASTAAKARIIDAPRYEGKVSPKSKIIMLGAFVFGLAFPVGLVYLLGLLRYKIEGREDVEKLTKLPLLADIPLGPKTLDGEHKLAVRENSNDLMEESFRGLRTNLRFVLDDNEHIIACTSCIPGEGKTFISTNLAMSLALLGKRVVIVGLDIRRPRLVKLFGLPADKRGITTFLSSTEETFDLLDQQIIHGVVNPNLDVLPAGIIPPNPGELISRIQLDRAMDLLREHYDYVILDTPPVGLVSDTLAIARVADMTLMVCRADYSPKSNFKLINELKQDNKMPKISLVLNGVDLRKRKYGYYYGYGKYGKYGKYGHYGNYGLYGHYGNRPSQGGHTEK